MALEPSDLTAALEERRFSPQSILDSWESFRQDETMLDWKDRQRIIDDIYADRWQVVWPDRTRSDGLPKVPNLVKITAEDRARQVASQDYSLVVRAEQTGDTETSNAEKRERLLYGYHARSKVKLNIPRWTLDAIGGGLMAIKVLPDYGERKDQRYPEFCRVDPRYCYPDPRWAQGPNVDNMLVSYTAKIRDIQSRYGVDVRPLVQSQANKMMAEPEVIRCIEYYDGEQIAVLGIPIKKGGYERSPTGYEWLIEPTPHGLSKCPFVIGTLPTLDNVYRGQFDSALAVLNVWNRLMTMHLDAAVSKVYAATGSYDVENPDDWGPDAHLNFESKDARFEWIVPPGAAYDQQLLLKQMNDFARASVILPLARSGDPNESVISAAGVGAVSGQSTDVVRSLQNDVISPTLEAANELAFEVDEKLCDGKKKIYGEWRGSPFAEDYVPSKVIKGNYRNKVSYGFAAGLDLINRNTLILTNVGNGLMTKKTGMENSPLIEDYQREVKQMAKEKLEDATFAGLLAKAAGGELQVEQLAKIRKDLESDKSLYDSIIDNLALQPAPLAPPPAPGGSPPNPQSPGIAGAGEPQPGFGGPPLEELLGGPRP